MWPNLEFTGSCCVAKVAINLDVIVITIMSFSFCLAAPMLNELQVIVTL